MLSSFFLKRPFLPISLALCTGLFSGAYLSGFDTGAVCLFAALFCLLLCVIFLGYSFKDGAVVFYCLFFVFFGILIIKAEFRCPEFSGRQTAVCEFGKIIGVSKPRKDSGLKITVSAVLLESGNRRIKGRNRALVTLYLKGAPQWDFKDVFEVKAVILKNPDFPFSSYKYRIISSELIGHRKTDSRFFGIVGKTKKKIIDIVEKEVAEPGSSVIIGMLTGDRQGIPDEVNHQFLRSGTAHILAVSGLHVGLLSGFVFLILRLLRLEKRFAGFCLSSGIVWFYIAMTGFAVPSVRAGIMVSVLTGSLVLRRSPDLINVLCFSLLIMLLLNPASLFEPSFQLSFAAISAIVFYSRYLTGERKPLKIELVPGPVYKVKVIRGRFFRILSEYFKLSFIIWLFTCPVILLRFDMFNMLTPFANIPVVFLSTIIINTAFASLLISLVLPFGVRVFAVCGIFVKPLLFITELFSVSALKIDGIFLKTTASVFILVCLSVVFWYSEKIKGRFLY
ncbi:MAG: ComEC/Rec2 family competence protein [bacterium]|nr:ComEC/Rec2 family competence protein [bacterium]